MVMDWLYVRRGVGVVASLAVALCVLVGWSVPMTRGIAWSLAMLLSYDGWGRLVELGMRRAGRDERVDAGLRLAWGVALTLLIGGIACMVHVASRPFLLGQLGVGLGLSVLLRLVRPPSLSRRRLAVLRAWHFHLLLALVVLIVAIEMFAGASMTWTNMSDDEPLYFFLPQKLLATGSLYDPFDVRRMTSYGGQFYLHAQFLTLGSHHQLNVVDAGVGTFLVMAHVLGEAARQSDRRSNLFAGVLAVLLIASIDHVRYNVGSLMTCLGAMLGAHRSWDWLRRSSHRGPLDFFLLGACAVTAFVLRTSCAIPLTAYLSLSIGLDAWRSSAPDRLRVAVRHVFLLGAACLLALLPWLVTFRESTGTLIYPLARGNLTPGFAILKVESGWAFNLRHVLTDLAYAKPISTSLVLLGAALLPTAWRRSQPARVVHRDARMIAVIVLVSFCFTSIMGGAFDPPSNARYYFGFLMWGLLVVIWSSPAAGRPSLLGPRALLVSIALLVHLTSVRNTVRDRWLGVVNTVEAGYNDVVAVHEADARMKRAYRDAQQSVPAGSGIAATVQEPFRFDLRRNSVLSLDLPGGMGPAPGFPCFKGPDALADYLQANGLRYLITVDYLLTYKNMELFDLPAWRRHRSLERSFLIYEAPFVVDAMENVLTLLKTRRVVFKNDLLTVIDLQERVEAPPPPAP